MQNRGENAMSLISSLGVVWSVENVLLQNRQGSTPLALTGTGTGSMLHGKEYS